MILVTIQFLDSFQILVIESILLISLCFDDFNTKNWSLLSSNCYHHNVTKMIKFKVIHHGKLLMVSTSNTLKHIATGRRTAISQVSEKPVIFLRTANFKISEQPSFVSETSPDTQNFIKNYTNCLQRAGHRKLRDSLF